VVGSPMKNCKYGDFIQDNTPLTCKKISLLRPKLGIDTLHTVRQNK